MINQGSRFQRHNWPALVILFLFYAMMGWCYEVFLEVVVYQWGFSNRGVLFGPYCPIYAVGGFLFLLCFERFKRRRHGGIVAFTVKPLLLFIGCALVATLLELAASYALEALTGSWPWQTYVDYQYNFQGRVALSTSVRFGLGGLLCLYALQPLFDKILELLPTRVKTPVAAGILALLSLDIICTVLR